jgi:hypothetical protein
LASSSASYKAMSFSRSMSFFCADRVGGTSQIGFRDIAELLGLGEQFSSDEHGEWLGMMD